MASKVGNYKPMTELAESNVALEDGKMRLEEPAEDLAPVEPTCRAKSIQSKTEPPKKRADTAVTSTNNNDETNEDGAKELSGRRSCKRKLPSTSLAKDSELQNFGHVFLPRMAELWRQVWRVPPEMLDPFLSKNSPLGKNHFNVHIYWFLVSSIYAPRASLKPEQPSSRCGSKGPVGKGALGGLMGLVAKLKSCESTEAMKKKVAELASEEKAKLGAKPSSIKKTKQLKAAEAVLSYIKLKQSVMDLESLWSDQKTEQQGEPTGTAEEQMGQGGEGSRATGQPGAHEIDEHENPNDTKMTLLPEAELRAGRERQGEESGGAAGRSAAPSASPDSTCRRRDGTLGSKDWREFGRKNIKGLIESIRLEQEANSAKIEQLVRTSEARKAEHELSWRQFGLTGPRKGKREASGLFCNTMRDSDLLYHCSSLLKIERKYLQLLDEDAKKRLPAHRPCTDGGKSELSRGSLPRTRAVLQGGGLPGVQLGRVHGGKQNRILRGELTRAATYRSTRTATG